MDRKEKRQQRLHIITRINKIELDNCEQCKYQTITRRTKQSEVVDERSYCLSCPIYEKLNLLGVELVAFSKREDRGVIIEEEIKHADVEVSNAGRKPVREQQKFSEIPYLRAKARNLSNQAIMDKYGISRSTIQKKIQKWGYKNLCPSEARRLLNIKLGLCVK